MQAAADTDYYLCASLPPERLSGFLTIISSSVRRRHLDAAFIIAISLILQFISAML